MSAEQADTVTLFGAKDAEGRLYLTDSRNHLPSNVVEVKEFRVAPDKVEWAILQMHVEEIRLSKVTIRIGDYDYATPPLPDISQWLPRHQEETP